MMTGSCSSSTASSRAGLTLREVARKLKEDGATSVGGIVLARQPFRSRRLARASWRGAAARRTLPRNE
jgi:hypoxanthine-guanine phosphoribosyltransferase